MRFLILLLFVSLACYSQQEVKLRDLTLKIPAGWKSVNGAEYAVNFESKLNYEWYYEVGGVFSDSADYHKEPYIAYQYYDIPGMYMMSFDTLVKERVQSHREDFGRLDTIVVNERFSYFYVAFEREGKSMLYAQSLGKNGALHTQWLTARENMKHDIPQFESFLSGISFTERYYDLNAEAALHEEQAAESSKWIFIFEV